MSMYPSERDYLAEERKEAEYEAKQERLEERRIESKTNSMNMEVGQAVNIVQMEENIYRSGWTPIHRYIQQIIPYLEQRQEAAKRLYEYKGKSAEADEQYKQLIIWCNSKISDILNFIHNQ